VADRDLQTKWEMPIELFNNTIKLLVRKLGTLHGRNLFVPIFCMHLNPKIMSAYGHSQAEDSKGTACDEEVT